MYARIQRPVPAMADLIEPSHFDAAVITTGLPEVLLASALARAGKTVLVLDAADSFGGTWASLSGADFVQQLLNSSLASSHDSEQQQKQQQQQQQPTSTDDAPQQRPQHLAGVQDCSLYTHPKLDQALEHKGLIIDLAPRVLYQDEPLVQLLVSCQAHNYLEFKLVEGNYVYCDGQLQLVPASRADLFSDRSLSLADKRSLGRFMAACVEAAEGSGRLKDAFDSRPLVELLAAEGLNQRVQQVVLYGIAMADVPQQALTQPQQQQQQQDGLQPPAAPAAQGVNPTKPQQQQQQQPQQQQQYCQAGQLTAAQGLAAFVLYSQSLGRYSGSGALMAPCYGCGSLTEAFVRLAAVKGAVTALRHGTSRLQLLPQAAAPAAAPSDGEQQPQQQPAVGGDAQADAGDGVAQVAAQESAGEGSATAAAAAAAGRVATAPARVSLTLSSGQTITAGHVISSSSSSSGGGCTDDSSGSINSSSSSSVCVARAVAVLDGSLVPGDTSLLFVIPPGTLGPWQAAVIRGLQLGHALAVAPPGHCLLYLSAVMPPQQDTAGPVAARPATAESAAAGPVAAGPAAAAGAEAGAAGGGCGSAFSLSSAAEQLLGPALAAVADTRYLQQFAAVGSEAGPGAAAGEADDSSQQQQQEQQGADGQQQQPDVHGARAAQPRPQVLAAAFYTIEQDAHTLWPQQQQQQRQHQQAGAGSSSCVVRCLPAPAAGFAGFTASISAVEALFRQHFSDLPWLTDPLPQQQQQQQQTAAMTGGNGHEVAEGGEADGGSSSAGAAGTAAAAAGGGGVIDEDELDAIDELTAALLELSSGLYSAQEQGGQGSAAQSLHICLRAECGCRLRDN